MKILALVGSPRKGSNTDILVEQILKGCQAKGYACEKLYLYDYEISPCIDCRDCKKGDHVCTINDEMQGIYAQIEEADLLIFGTPLYWYGPSAKMKLLIDRMRPFVANGKLRGKKGAVVVPSQEGPKVCRAISTMFRMIFDHLDMEFTGEILATANEKAEIGENREELRKAYAFGISL